MQDNFVEGIEGQKVSADENQINPQQSPFQNLKGTHKFGQKKGSEAMQFEELGKYQFNL